MTAPLTPRERAALEAAEKAGGLIRGRKGFYPGFYTMGEAHGPSTVHALVRRGLMTRPHGSPARRVMTDAGRVALSGGTSSPALPAAAPPRAYID